jgi:hypothetical protein
MIEHLAPCLSCYACLACRLDAWRPLVGPIFLERCPAPVAFSFADGIFITKVHTKSLPFAFQEETGNVLVGRCRQPQPVFPFAVMAVADHKFTQPILASGSLQAFRGSHQTWRPCTFISPSMLLGRSASRISFASSSARCAASLYIK